MYAFSFPLDESNTVLAMYSGDRLFNPV